MNFQGRRFAAGETIYSEWFSRGGDNMILRGQAVERDSTSSVTFNIFTKNPDEAGDPAHEVQDSGGTDYSLVLDDPATAGGFKEIVVTSEATALKGLKTLIRLQATATGTFILARLFPPVFFDHAS